MPHCLIHCHFCSANITALYTDCVLWHSVCITVCNIPHAVTICLSFCCLSAVFWVWFSWQYNALYRLCVAVFALHYILWHLPCSYSMSHSFDCQLSLHSLLLKQYILQNHIDLYWFCEELVEIFHRTLY